MDGKFGHTTAGCNYEAAGAPEPVSNIHCKSHMHGPLCVSLQVFTCGIKNNYKVAVELQYNRKCPDVVINSCHGYSSNGMPL